MHSVLVTSALALKPFHVPHSLQSPGTSWDLPLHPKCELHSSRRHHPPSQSWSRTRKSLPYSSSSSYLHRPPRRATQKKTNTWSFSKNIGRAHILSNLGFSFFHTRDPPRPRSFSHWRNANAPHSYICACIRLFSSMYHSSGLPLQNKIASGSSATCSFSFHIPFCYAWSRVRILCYATTSRFLLWNFMGRRILLLFLINSPRSFLFWREVFLVLGSWCTLSQRLHIALCLR